MLDWLASMLKCCVSFVLYSYSIDNELVGPSSLVVPFVACGDLNGFDADKSYPLQLSDSGEEYKYKDPIQPPINPNYQTSLRLTKHGVAKAASEETVDS